MPQIYHTVALWVDHCASFSRSNVLTSCRANSVLSPLGWGVSMAKTTQLAMMVRRTVYSNGGHSIRNTVSLRNGLLSVRMKREVGPSFFSSFFGLRPMVRSQPQSGLSWPWRLEKMEVAFCNNENKWLMLLYEKELCIVIIFRKCITTNNITLKATSSHNKFAPEKS